jgi:ubiquinone/menaquinone biosynthesis C-methylase UbiE
MAADEATRARCKQEVEREFAHPRYLAGSRSWQETTRQWFGPLTERLLAAARLEPGVRVLDVGSGTGEPALIIAGRVGPGGAVVATDPSPDLLALTEEQAARAGLANLTCQPADVTALPFPDAAFDRVTCRLAAMYFLDPVAGLAEMRRVLVPGGRAAVLVWGDPGHAAYAAAFFGPIVSRVLLPEPEPGSPHPYRFAAPGALRQAIEAAGFREVEEQVQLVSLRFPGTAADYMRWFRDMATPMDYIWEALGPQETERAVAEIVANMRSFEAGGAVQTNLEVIVGAGVR